MTVRTLLALGLAALLAATNAPAAPSPERPKLIVGVTEFALTEDGRDITEALHRAAAPLADEYDLEFRSMPVPELERAAREGRVDLVLGSAGLVVRLADAGSSRPWGREPSTPTKTKAPPFSCAGTAKICRRYPTWRENTSSPTAPRAFRVT